MGVGILEGAAACAHAPPMDQALDNGGVASRLLNARVAALDDHLVEGHSVPPLSLSVASPSCIFLVALFTGKGKGKAPVSSFLSLSFTSLLGYTLFSRRDLTCPGRPLQCPQPLTAPDWRGLPRKC